MAKPHYPASENQDSSLAERPLPGSSPSGLGEIFHLLREGKSWTRAELAATTGLARSTVASRVDRLLEVGLIRSEGESPSNGGRPASRFSFNADYAVILAVDVGAQHLAVAVTDLNGVLLESVWRDVHVTLGPQHVLELVIKLGTELLESVATERRPLIGVGIGLPGPVEFSSGKPNKPPIMPGWDGFDVPAFLHEHWPVPVLVDNDVNIMALGEHFTHWRDKDDFLFVKLATGIGSGIISGGILQRGANGTSGDLGHVRVPGGADIPCHCGNTGCLEALASGTALATQLSQRGLPSASVQEVLALADSGTTAAVHAVRQAGRDIGEVLAMCVNMLNPSVIVVGGALAQAGEHLLAGAREAVYRRSQPLATQRLRIEQSRAGRDAGVLGASRLCIDHVLAPQSLEHLLG